jgi:two-component system sensor histidine kinase DesK
MRRYTTVSMVTVVVLFSGFAMISDMEFWVRVGVLVAGALVAVQFAFWDRLPPLWILLPALAVSLAVWIACLMTRGAPLVSVLLSLSIVQLISVQPRRYRWPALAAGALLVLLPVGAFAALRADDFWEPWAVSAVIAFVAAALTILLNGYSWGLYLQLDEARKVSAELAVAKERFRFAADLHDIQGHTLHVIRLKTQLAQKLLDRDPAAARAHLAEADQLIAETLANTRSLAFGERQVSLSSELANAGELLTAAGIGWHVDGAIGAGPPHELFGLVVRETTTNILRHAQPTEVRVALAPGRLRIENDGSATSARPLSGLARLGERFEAAGGVLRTTRNGDRFVTEAELP